MMQRPEGRTTYAPSSLGRAVSTYVVAAEGIAAGIVIRALERDGLNVEAAWGSMDELGTPERERVGLVIVVEPDGDAHPDADYARLRSLLPDATIAVICAAERERVRALIWAGADGIVFEPGADAVIGPAVRAMLAGYVIVPQVMRAGLQLPPLTRRERQILELVVDGLTNREIAERLYLAESTVKRHLSSTFRRLGVNSRREAAAAARAAEQSFGAVRASEESEAPDPGSSQPS